MAMPKVEAKVATPPRCTLSKIDLDEENVDIPANVALSITTRKVTALALHCQRAMDTGRETIGY